MRRFRSALLLFLVPALLVVGAYTAYWYWAAGQTRQTVQGWVEARRVEGFKIGWSHYAIDGFPFSLRIAFDKPVFGRSGSDPGYEARAPALVATARPWALRRWRIAAVSGATLAVDPGQARPAVKIQASSLEAQIAPAAGTATEPRGTAVALAADGVTVDAGTEVAIGHATVLAVLPQGAVPSHLDTWATARAAVSRVTLPLAVEPLGRTIDHLAAQLAIKGTIPGGPQRRALDAWRQDGGTLEVEALRLDWGKLALDATGTLALDGALQPEGALTAHIHGYGEVVDALVAAGSLKSGDGAIAKLALGLLAKPGADGTPQITAPLRLQEGQLFLGPARLARLPVFTWE